VDERLLRERIERTRREQARHHDYLERAHDEADAVLEQLAAQLDRLAQEMRTPPGTPGRAAALARLGELRTILRDELAALQQTADEIEARVREHERQEREWEQRAERAVAADRDDLALAALERAREYHQAAYAERDELLRTLTQLDAWREAAAKLPDAD
jgi:cell division protein ZapA (FtsZ GTPase activity inhibitor)